MQNNECIRAKWKGKSMDVFSSYYSSVSVDFVCDRYSLEESKCKKSFVLLAIAVLCQVLAARKNSG